MPDSAEERSCVLDTGPGFGLSPAPGPCYKGIMSWRMWSLVGVGLTVLSVGAAADFERYAVIVNRKPFGEELQPPAPAAAVVVPPGESVVNKVKMTAVVRDEAGTLRVGIVDLKSNRNYLLGIGDSLEGMEVVEADYEKERARLRRGVEDYWVSMYGGSNKFEAVGKAVDGGLGVVPAVTNTVASARPGTEARAAAPAARKGALDQRLSYALRKVQREAARRRAEEAVPETRTVESRGTNAPAAVMRAGSGAAPAGPDAEVMMVMQSLTNQAELTEAEVAQLLQEYQKTLIRSGQTPLQIPLTPETDAQLVEEGYLPPQP